MWFVCDQVFQLAGIGTYREVLDFVKNTVIVSYSNVFIHIRKGIIYYNVPISLIK